MRLAGPAALVARVTARVTARNGDRHGASRLIARWPPRIRVATTARIVTPSTSGVAAAIVAVVAPAVIPPAIAPVPAGI